MPKENIRSGSQVPATIVKKRTIKQAVVPPKPITAAERIERQMMLAAQEEPSKVNNLRLTLERPEHPSRREPLSLVMKDELEEFKRTNEETGEIRYATHPYGPAAQFRRRVYSTMREVHAFRKLNPIDAERIRDGNKLVYWQAYAENNDQAKYFSILVGDGYPGRLCIIGPKVFWEPIMSDEKFARLQVSAPPRVELHFNKYTQINLRFLGDRIVVHISLGEEYTSNGERGIDHHDHCFILWSGHTAITAIQMISWVHKNAVEASGDAAAKALAYAEDDEAPPIEQLEKEYDTAYDAAHVGREYPAYGRYDKLPRKLRLKEKIPFNVRKQTDRWGGLGEEEGKAGPEALRATNPWEGERVPRAFRKFSTYFL